MIKKITRVDDFMNEVRNHITGLQTDPMWAQRVDDLEVVLRALFIPDSAGVVARGGGLERC
jgi:hypothetical protein